MKFHFSLESLLKVRKREEDSAKQEYLEAKHQLDLALQEINEMYESIDHYRSQFESLSNDPLQGVKSMAYIDDFIGGQKIRIENARLKARELMTIAEEKQEKLVEARRGYKMIEKLKEKRLNEFLQLRKKKELRMIDDLFTIRSHGGFKK